MHLFSALHLLYAVSGLVVGLLVGLTGVGGGSLMTPLLVLLFGIHPTTAVGTDLLYAAATKSVGTAVHGASGSVDWRIVGHLALGSVPASVTTLLVLAHFGAHGVAANHAVTLVLGLALIATALAIVFRRIIVDRFGRHAGTWNVRRTSHFTVLLGSVLGILVSISSVGAGAIGVTALLVLYPSIPAGRLVGSDIAHAVPLTLIAGFGHWWIGSVDVGLLVSLLCGSVPGVAIGSLLAARIPDKVLRPVLASTLALVGGRLIF